MDDVLGYAGKRVIVAGAASGVGAATARLLIELGAEVHAVDDRKPDLGGLASFTEIALGEPAQIDAAADRIGSIVNALFNCAGAAGLSHLTARAVPLMVDGSAVGSVTFGDQAITEYTAAQAPALSQRGVRINCVDAGDAAPPDAVAWPLLFLNSPRASHVSGATLTVEGGFAARS